jgi:GH25 family lysozyme M1 (1,4-beta-N-acetylmuramidase)
MAIDVSEFQGGINWPIVPVQRVWIRCTMGTAGVDAQVHNNLSGAEHNHFVYGGYHFLENSNPAVQIEHFLSVWHPTTGLRGMVDVESSAFSNPTHDLVVGAVQEYQKLTGHYPILYGGTDTLAALALPSWIVKCPLMIADYGPNDGSEHPLTIGIPKPWTEMSVHQFTSKGRVVGISANTVDLDHVYNGPAVVVPRPRPFIDKWQVSYVKKRTGRTRKFTRTPTLFQQARPRAKYRGAIHVYPHRVER